MRALVIGGSGQVGAALLRALAQRGHDATGTYGHHPAGDLAQLDITDHAAVGRAVAAARPDWVLCPAGLTHVDRCEEHPDEAFAINRDGALAAARAARDAGAGFVFYSTEYVFDGASGPYAEDDAASPLSVYGRSKWEGERAVLAEVPRALVIRTTVVYGPERQAKNFVYQLIRHCRRGQPMRVASDQVSSPTYNVDLAQATVELCERDARRGLSPGRDGILDRYAFARLACEVFGLDGSGVVPVDTAAFKPEGPASAGRAGLDRQGQGAARDAPARRPRRACARCARRSTLALMAEAHATVPPVASCGGPAGVSAARDATAGRRRTVDPVPYHPDRVSPWLSSGDGDRSSIG